MVQTHVARTSILIGGNRIYDSDFTSVELVQCIGTNHTFEIGLVQDASRGALEEKAKEWMGKIISIGFDLISDDDLFSSPVQEGFSGIITNISLSRQSGIAELILKGFSHSGLLDDGPTTRSFTDKSLQEIVDEVLNDYKSSFPNDPIIAPKNHIKPIPYVVQYKESNLAFISRLASRYGEWFYEDGLQLYFGKPEAEEPLTLNFGESSLTDFNLEVNAIPTNFELKAYDYKKHEVISEESKQQIENSKLGKEIIDIVNSDIYPQQTSNPVNIDINKKDLQELNQRMEQVMLDEMVTISCESRNPYLKVGAQIEIKDNLIGENYGQFTITDIKHEIKQSGDYSNTFTGIPIEVPTARSAYLPDPPFCETQLAKVKKVDDEDGLGRVKVEFIWQEGKGETTPWIRVASPYTGNDKGFYMIPEVGDQVLVAFENSNPDRPYVLSGMYNNDAKPEWFDGKNNYKGFKTRKGNQIKFDDKNKSILLDAPNSMKLSAGKEIVIETDKGKDSTITIDAGEGTVEIKAAFIYVTATESNMVEAPNIYASADLIDEQCTQYILSASQTAELCATKSVDIVGGGGTINSAGGKVKINS